MRLLTTSLLLCMAVPSFAAERMYAVQVGEEATLAAARKSAALFAKKLSLGALSDEGEIPTAPAPGAGIQIYRAGKAYALVAYVGEAGAANIALELIRREVRSATLTAHEIEPVSISLLCLPVHYV